MNEQSTSVSSFDLECISGGPFGTNAYLIADTATGRCAIVDPGYDADQEWPPVLRERGLTLESIILTHGHIDHTVGVAPLLRAYPGTPVLIHRDDVQMLTGGNAAAATMLGLPPYEAAQPTGWLEEGVPVKVGETSFDVLHVPGHSPGSVALFADKILISGDVIFMESIGRTDLPGGNYNLLADSIVKKLLPLGDDVTVIPGHGPVTTLGRERLTNSFILEMLER